MGRQLIEKNRLRFRFRFTCILYLELCNQHWCTFRMNVFEDKVVDDLFLGRLGGSVLAVLVISITAISIIWHIHDLYSTRTYGFSNISCQVYIFSLGVPAWRFERRGLFARVPTQCNHAEETCHDGGKLKRALEKLFSDDFFVAAMERPSSFCLVKIERFGRPGWFVSLPTCVNAPPMHWKAGLPNEPGLTNPAFFGVSNRDHWSIEALWTPPEN